jgi:hypothetical protein
MVPLEERVTALAALVAILFVPGPPGSDALRATAYALGMAASQARAAVGGTSASSATGSSARQKTGTPVAELAEAPRSDVLYLRFEEADIEGTKVNARNVEMTYGEYALRGGRLEGDLDAMLLFTGSPALTYRGQSLFGDAIRFYPKSRDYRIENLRSSLTPEFLQGYAVAPVYLSGGSVSGKEQEPIIGADTAMTTCDRPRPHYEVLARSIEVQPGERITLRHAALKYRGKQLIALPTIVVPLGRRLPRGGYQPYVGRSQEEGWFVKTGFNYLLDDHAPGMYRVDLMERKGIGIGVEQSWRAKDNAGEATLYGIPVGGQGRNMSGRLQSQLRLAGGQLDLGYDFRQNDYRTLPDSSDSGVRLGYSLRSGVFDTRLNFSRRSNQSGTYRSTSDTATLGQRLSLSQRGSLSFDADYARYESGITGSVPQITERLNARLQGDYRAPNYVLQVAANRNVPIGGSTAQSYFGGVERLPEITLSQFRFTGGPLARAPLTFSVGAGKYSEGGISGTLKTVTERATAGFDLTSLRVQAGPHGELNLGGGFTQYLYGEGAAQYILRSSSSFTQRWGGKSGFNLRHTYQQPHGGTPFRFDRQGKFHSITGDVGWLDDPRLQVSARFGYDLAGISYGGSSEPWQSVSANVYWRPVDALRLRTLFTFNPNNGQFTSVTNDLRLRGGSDLAVDIVSRYDPRSHRFGQVNAYMNLPVLPAWRAVVLTQYNGYLNRFETRNFQIIHDMHCLEASLTFIDNPYGWRAERQIMFQIRIKAFPVFQQFGTGLYGQALDTSVGGADF